MMVQVDATPDGKILTTPISAPKESGGRQRVGLLGAIQDGIAGGMEEADALVKLSNGYLFLTPAKRRALMEKAEVSILPDEGIAKLVVKDLLQKGDRVVNAFEGKTCRQMNTRVETSAGGIR